MSNKVPPGYPAPLDGPWTNEPDGEAFEHAGYTCVIARGGGGIWCGYVAIFEHHPLYKLDHRDGGFDSIKVHGGLTFSGLELPAHALAFLAVAPGARWLGFDCGHAGDLAPWMSAPIVALCKRLGWPYRDIAFARNEVRSLASQLRACAEMRRVTSPAVTDPRMN